MANMPDAPGGMTADRLRSIADALAYSDWPAMAKQLRAHADSLEAREKAGVDVQVEGMLSAEEYEAVLQKLSNEAKYGHSGFASDSVICNCSVHRLWNHMRACERALRDSRNLLREAEARGDEWKRVANEREGALRDTQLVVDAEADRATALDGRNQQLAESLRQAQARVERLAKERDVAQGVVRDRLSHMATERYEARITALEKALRRCDSLFDVVSHTSGLRCCGNYGDRDILKHEPRCAVRMTSEALAQQPPQAGGEVKP